MPEPDDPHEQVREKLFRKAVEDTLAAEDVKQGIVAYGHTEEALRDELLVRRAIIEEEAAEYEQAHLVADAAKESASKVFSDQLRRGRSALWSTLAGLGPLVLVGLAAEALLSLPTSLPNWLDHLIDLVGPWAVVGGALLLLGISVASARTARSRAMRLISDLEIEKLESNSQQSLDAWQLALRQGAGGEARSILSRDAPENAHQLLATSAPGLSEAELEEGALIDTPAKQAVENLVQTMRGGSIGLAGPRGVGKSTIMRALGGPTPDTIGVAVSAPVRYEPREFFLYLFEKLCRAIAGDISEVQALVPRRRRLGLLESYRLALGRSPNLPAAERPADVESESRRLLGQLTFQRTFTAGGGAELALLNALKVDAKVEQQTTETPWSLPQLVHNLRDHLALVAKTKRVVITIDELDKVRSSEEANAFLSDVKAIFGVRRVFFLVSVSEEAMASFERRGHGIRDAFDSAFDEIIAVEPLGYERCRDLLNRRVIGMSSPFVGLATALGGGLPREVIRVARQCVIAARAEPPASREFDQVLRRVVQEELRAVAGGARHVVVAAGFTDGGREMLEWLDRVTEVADVAGCNSALIDANGLDIRNSTMSDEWRPLAERTVAEVRVRILFCSTLMSLFEAAGPSHLDRVVSEGWVDRLSRVRARLSLGPELAERALERLREDAQLP